VTGTVGAGSGVGSVVAIPTTGPQEEATADTVTRLRRTVLPAVVGEGPATAHVGGATANLAEIGRRVNDRLPVFVAAVLAMSFVLLMLVFRSVVVPLKAVLLNLLSIGASYGVVVMVFQWGWGGCADRAGVDGARRLLHPDVHVRDPVRAVDGLRDVPAVAVREEYLRTGDNGRAIVDGIAGTARVITSAALIMITVFLGFVFGENPAIKMFGLGLATAILIDATIVRMVLVPATMTLLGRANWWLPAWLDRLLPRVAVDAAPTDLTGSRPGTAGAREPLTSANA
jgi:RND superfamily putative drug exporter